MITNEAASEVLVPEPIFEQPDFDQFVSDDEREYRKWKTCGGDIALMLVEILAHGRRHSISMSEIAASHFYRRCSPAEKYALLLACSDNLNRPLSDNDAERFRVNDQLLADFVDHKLLGHRDFQNRVLSIPSRLDERKHFDEQTLPYASKYESPALFVFIFGKPA